MHSIICNENQNHHNIDSMLTNYNSLVSRKHFNSILHHLHPQMSSHKYSHRAFNHIYHPIMSNYDQVHDHCPCIFGYNGTHQSSEHIYSSKMSNDYPCDESSCQGCLSSTITSSDLSNSKKELSSESLQ